MRSTYWTVQHGLPLVATFLNVALQRARIKRLQQLKAAQKLIGHCHHGTPIIELSAVLSKCQQKNTGNWG